MKRLIQIYRNTDLRIRLPIFGTIMLLLVIFACQATLYSCVVRYMDKEAQLTAELTLTQTQTYMDTKLGNVVERLFYTRLDPSFEIALTNFLLSDNVHASGVAMSLLSPALSLHKITEPLISSLFLYTPKGSFTDMGVSVTMGYRFEESAFWPLLQQQAASIIWAPLQQDEIFITHRNVVPVMYRFQVDGYGQSSVLLANIDALKLGDFLQDIAPKNDAAIFLVDESGVPITQLHSPQETDLVQNRALFAQVLSFGDSFDKIIADNQEYLAAHRALKNAPWNLVYLHSQSKAMESLKKIRILFFGVSLVAAGILLCMLYHTMRCITQPLHQLSVYMSDAQFTPHSQPPIECRANHEIGRLTASFHTMLRQIDGLLDEQQNYITQLQEEKNRVQFEQQLKRRAELKALQAQINPHFLYNTLDSIRWKADRIGAEDISRMTTALARLFRIGLSRGHELISIENELQHVRSYLEIQKERYGEKLTYTIVYDNAVLHFYTVKLLLQPLVENAIYHGIKESTIPGKIEIKVQQREEVVVMEVQDNGTGISESRLAMLQKDLERGVSDVGDGYGIFNVNERIRLHCGAKYGLTLESKVGKGTKATICLPCITQNKEE